MASRGTMAWATCATRAALALTIMVTLGACGGDDDGGGGDSGAGGSAGKAGGGSGSGAGGAGGRAGSTSTAGTGGAGGAGGAAGTAPMIMCSDTAPTAAITCGSDTCPIPMTFMGIDTCTRPCCVMDGADEVCGTENTNTMMPTDCALPPEPDPRCPDYTDSLMTMREGCCTADDKCGVVSTILGQCVTTSMLVPTLPATPPDCDAADADGGT